MVCLHNHHVRFSCLPSTHQLSTTKKKCLCRLDYLYRAKLMNCICNFDIPFLDQRRLLLCQFYTFTDQCMESRFFVTCSATRVWLNCPRRPQSPTARMLSDPSVMGGCSTRVSSAAAGFTSNAAAANMASTIAATRAIAAEHVRTSNRRSSAGMGCSREIRDFVYVSKRRELASIYRLVGAKPSNDF